MTLVRSAATVGGFTMISRLLGFLRDVLLAAILGAGPVADAFFVAFKLPNFFRRLFAEGAFNAAFVPLFSGLLSRRGPVAAKIFAGEALSVLLWALLVLVVSMQLAMPWVMLGLAPGFAKDPAKFDLAVQFTRATFPYLLFISLVSLFSGVLNAMGRFAAAAATPILLNICLIGALLGLARLTPTPGHALAWGVAVAGVVQFLWLVTACHRAGILPRLPRPRLTPGVRRLLRIMLPAALGAGVVQLNLLIDIIIASLLPSGSVSFLYYANRINQLPLGVIGVALGTALLPLLSRQLTAGDTAGAQDSQSRAVEFCLLLTIPAAAALVVAAHPIVDGLFGRGAFTPDVVSRTAWALAAYALGLPAYVLVKVLVPGYYARGDTATPVKYAVVALFVNLALNLALMIPLAHVGIALATAISAWVNAGLLAWGLSRRGMFDFDTRLQQRLLRILAASAVMAVALELAVVGLADAFAGGEVTRATALAALVVGGLSVFALAAHLLGATNLTEFPRKLRRRG